MIDRKQLEEAICRLRVPGVIHTLGYAIARDIVIAAAEAHLATLPKKWRVRSWYGSTGWTVQEHDSLDELLKVTEWNLRGKSVHKIEIEAP